LEHFETASLGRAVIAVRPYFHSPLKVREGAFDPTIRQFVTTDRGIVVGEPFEGVEAILSGMPREAARNAA
jgi:hypothetical protein